MADRDDFYVGYLDAPPALAGFLRILGLTLLPVAVLFAILAATGQEPLPAAAFEFGTVRTAEGYLIADPYPSLLVPRGSVASRYLLVGQGKHGVDEEARAQVNRWVSLEGTLVYRDPGESVGLARGNPGLQRRPDAGRGHPGIRPVRS